MDNTDHNTFEGTLRFVILSEAKDLGYEEASEILHYAARSLSLSEAKGSE